MGLKVLLVIPAYNESGNLPKLLDRLKSDYQLYDLLVVDDCSTDHTALLCRERGIPVVSLPINLGIGGAVQTGLKYAFNHQYDIVIQVDGDGQHDPRYLSLLTDEITKGANVCIGSRFIEKNGFQSTFFRRVGIRYFQYLIYGLTGRNFTDPTSGFRAFDRKVIRFFSTDYPHDYAEPESIVVMVKQRFKIREIPVMMNEREEGTSSINTIRSIYYLIKVSLSLIVTRFTSRR
jgi:glycosyltransferase involved in cell wall biosynthesis